MAHGAIVANKRHVPERQPHNCRRSMRSGFSPRRSPCVRACPANFGDRLRATMSSALSEGIEAAHAAQDEIVRIARDDGQVVDERNCGNLFVDGVLWVG